MRLLIKLNVIFLLAFSLGLAATGYAAWRFLHANARDQVQQQSRLMMEATSSTRAYTSKQIRPLLEAVQQAENTFLPQTVPAYSATQVFGYLRQRYPDYTYKEATLNPTNLADRAVDWEADVVNVFRNDPSKLEFTGERDTPTGRSLYLAKPIQAVESCLVCHSVPEAAPPAMLKIYGTSNGFGWKVNEIVGAQIISVPESVPIATAEEAFRRLMFWLTGISLASLVLLNVALVFAVVRPVSRMSEAADEISKGNLDIPELPVQGRDEIAVLADAFNRMHRSLAKAMKMLGD